jgi:hypothetical protein
VATDQKSSLIVDEAAQTPSAIENELPAYRAISTRAVFSLVCGALSLFCFAHLYFLIFTILAIVLGISANIAIKRHPEMLTGHRLANAGIASGLIFGLVALTYSVVQDFVLNREAQKFGQKYADVLNRRDLGETLWYGLHPETRKSKTPDQARQEFDTAKTRDRMMFEQRMAPLMNLRKRLSASSNEQVHFVDIENQGMEPSHSSEISYFALALFEVEGPGSKEFPEQRQSMLVVFKGTMKGRHSEWWVDDIQFPYKPKSYVVKEKPVDDGHGHPH